MAKAALHARQFTDEAAAIACLEVSRWPDGVTCPHCGTDAVTRMGGQTQAGYFQCNDCRDKFTCRTGTVMERSHVPIHKWLFAIHLLSAAKSGMSSHQLSRLLGLSYKTSWFLAHRIREAMIDSNPTPLGGKGKSIQADETYTLNSSKRGKHYIKGHSKKEQIVALVEPQGRVRAVHLKKATSEGVRKILVTHAHRSSELHTDESPLYTKVGGEFAAHMTHTQVRSFATWFFQFKNNLLSYELKASGVHPATWEKKGSDLFTTGNVNKYRAINGAGARLINRIYKSDGRLFFYGRQKYQKPQDSNSSGLYSTVISHAIRNLDRFCTHKDEYFMIILDQHEDRTKLLEASAKTMFGSEPARKLIEPPFQVESHLYQTIQAADWIAALTGRLFAFRTEPTEYADWDWAEKLIGTKIDAYSTHSSIWRPAGAAAKQAVQPTVAAATVTHTTVRKTARTIVVKVSPK